MTAPQSPYPGQSAPAPARPRLLRWAIWVAIGALILAAIVCVVWVLIGPENGIIGRAFLTILLLAAFAGVAILETHLAPRRPDWFSLTSMVTWVVTLLLGAFLVWMPSEDNTYGLNVFGRFVSFLVIVLVLALGLLHVRLFTKAIARHVTVFSRIVGVITLALVALLAVMLVVSLTFHEFLRFPDLYWRIVVAVTILGAVGTALVPLVNTLFAPKRERPAATHGHGPQGPGYALQAYPGQGPAGGPGYPQAHPAAPAVQPWPTFVDAVTPLPALPDGSPDWNAYYTGYPTPPPSAAPQHPAPHAEQTPAPAQPEPAPGYPPQPPLPPR